MKNWSRKDFLKTSLIGSGAALVAGSSRLYGQVAPAAGSAAGDIRVAVVGASGYAGAELLAILANHPSAQVVGLFGSSKKADEGTPTAADLFPRFEGTPIGALKILPFDVAAIAEAVAG